MYHDRVYRTGDLAERQGAAAVVERGAEFSGGTFEGFWRAPQNTQQLVHADGVTGGEQDGFKNLGEAAPLPFLPVLFALFLVFRRHAVLPPSAIES